jgi:hypothetical protein
VVTVRPAIDLPYLGPRLSGTLRPLQDFERCGKSPPAHVVQPPQQGGILYNILYNFLYNTLQSCTRHGRMLYIMEPEAQTVQVGQYVHGRWGKTCFDFLTVTNRLWLIRTAKGFRPMSPWHKSQIHLPQECPNGR